MRKWIRVFLCIFCIGFLTGAAAYTIGRDANSFMGIQRTPAAENTDPVKYGSLLVNGVRAPYDAGSGTWYVPQSPDAEEWVGELSWSDGSELFIVDDPMLNDKSAALTEGCTFTLDVREQGLTSVVFTGMPAVSLHTNSVTPVQGDKFSELFKGRFSFFDPTGQSGSTESGPDLSQYYIVGSDATWHARGATSMTFPKTSWRLELKDENGENLKIPLLDLRDDDDWILMSMYNDDSKIRDKMSIDLWNSIAEISEHDPIGTRMRYVEVFLDDRYDGLYGLLEPIDQKNTDMNTETDYLYKTLDWYCPTDAEMFAIRSEISRSFALKWPKEYQNGSQWQPLREYINMYYNATENTNIMIQEMRLNIPNVIDYALLVNAVTGIDNTFKNAYVCARLTEFKLSSMYVFTKIPWDLNYTWGEAWTDQNSLYTFFNPDLATANLMPGDIWTLINRDRENIVPQIKERWTELRGTVMSDETLLNHMDELRAYLDSTGAFERDSARWPASGNDPDLTEMKEFFAKRFEYLDSFYEKL